MEERSAAGITGEENVLALLGAPGEVGACAGLIAACCRRGRPPFVLVLGDGAGEGRDAEAAAQERALRAAAALAGLPEGRLLMAGLHAGQVPRAGPGFGAVVRGVALVMWARDCNVVLSGAEGEAAAVAAAVAAETGVGRLVWGGEEAWRLLGTREAYGPR